MAWLEAFSQLSPPLGLVIVMDWPISNSPDMINMITNNLVFIVGYLLFPN